MCAAENLFISVFGYKGFQMYYQKRHQGNFYRIHFYRLIFGSKYLSDIYQVSIKYAYMQKIHKMCTDNVWIRFSKWFKKQTKPSTWIIPSNSVIYLIMDSNTDVKMKMISLFLPSVLWWYQSQRETCSFGQSFPTLF